MVADHEDGCYAPGEAVTFTITVADGDTVPTGGTVRWQLSNDGVGDLGRGEAAWAGQPLTATGKLAQPGVLRLTAFLGCGAGRPAGDGPRRRRYRLRPDPALRAGARRLHGLVGGAEGAAGQGADEPRS
ncbi:MAG: hypothetical protein M5U09_18120 [Gammaproteobacteria bacterium]|nr:hypothetical protein [Gammaproteobacteria bacterium]